MLAAMSLKAFMHWQETVHADTVLEGLSTAHHQRVKDADWVIISAFL